MIVKAFLRFIDSFSVHHHNCKQSKNYVYFYELSAITLTANYAICNFIALLYERYLGGKQFTIKLRIIDNVKPFLKIEKGSYNL